MGKKALSFWHKKILRLFIIMVIAAVLLTGCLRSPQQGEPGGEAPAVVTVWHTLQGPEANALQTQIQGIMKAQPGVIVRLKYVPEQSFVSRAYQAEAGGEGPEIFLCPREILWKLYAQGALSPVVQYTSDAFPATQAQFRFSGKLYAQPFLTDLSLFYYRADSGLVPANLSELFGKGQLVVTALDMQTLGSWWSAQGGKLLAAETPQLNSPANLAFLQQLLTWRDAKVLQLNPNALNLFANGQAIDTIAWASQAPLLTQLNIPWRGISLNDLVGGQGQFLPGPTWGIANSSIKTTESMVQPIRLVEEALLNPDVEGALALAGHRFPTATGYYQHPETQQGLPLQVSQSLAKAWPLEGSSPERKLIPLQDAAWGKAYTGALSPADALLDAQNQALQKLAAGKQ
ncbi:MAG: extracellular solute-binding protein [Desulfitobacteriaceae bacterium]